MGERQLLNPLAGFVHQVVPKHSHLLNRVDRGTRNATSTPDTIEQPFGLRSTPPECPPETSQSGFEFGEEANQIRALETLRCCSNVAAPQGLIEESGIDGHLSLQPVERHVGNVPFNLHAFDPRQPFMRSIRHESSCSSGWTRRFPATVVASSTCQTLQRAANPQTRSGHANLRPQNRCWRYRRRQA